MPEHSEPQPAMQAMRRSNEAPVSDGMAMGEISLGRASVVILATFVAMLAAAWATTWWAPIRFVNG